ncbi:MAG: hypothetical protein AAFN79_04980 [Pseudomonadota bacterium]
MGDAKRRDTAVALAMTALGHERRVRLPRILSKERAGLSFEDLIAKSGLHLSTLYPHLRPMRAAELIVTERKGHRVLYKLKDSALRIAKADIGDALGEVSSRKSHRADMLASVGDAAVAAQ